MPDVLPNAGDLIRPATARPPLMLSSSHPAAPAPKPARESLPIAILRGLARRWRLAVVLGVMLGAIAGAAAWFLMPPPKPTVAAKLYIPQKPPGKLGEHPDPPLERSTQIQWIQSRVILAAAIRPPEVANLPILKAEADPLDWLGKQLTAEFLGPEILRVSLTHDDPEQARKLVDAVVNAYLERVANKSSGDRAARLKLMKDYIADLKGALTRQRDTIQSLSKGGVYESEKKEFLRKQLQMSISDAQRQFARAQGALKAGQAKERIFEADGNVELPDSLLDPYVDADRKVRTADALVKEQKVVVEDLRLKAPDEGPGLEFLKKAEAKLEALKKEHEESRASARADARSLAIAQSKTERATQLAKTRVENALFQEEINVFRNEIDAYTKTLSDIRINDGEIAPIQFEVTQTEKLLSGLLQAKQQLEIEQDAPPRVELMESATISLVDANKRKQILSAGAALAGLLLAFGLVGLFESRFRRVESPEAVSQQLGLRVVGTVPTPKAGPLQWFGNSDARTTAILTEAIANTRTMLLHGEGSSAHRVLLITSPVSGEGKTSLAVQLGVSIALAGHKTLIIDGDLRNPSAHERLRLTNQSGLCELLRGEASLLEAVQRTTVPGLDAISAGRWTPETAQALVTAPLGQLFTVWREQYDFVILDSSPVLPVTDALLLARHVDGVILSLLQGVSRVSQVAEACERFTSLRVNVIGAIVNGTSAWSYTGSDKYYHAAPASAAGTSTEQA